MEKLIGIKFKPVGKLYYFDTNDIELLDGEGVIVETERGLEYGEVVFENKKVTAEEIGTEIKKIIRKATEKDYEVLEVNNVKALEYGKKAKKMVAKLNLEMKLIDSEITFDSSKVIFTFTADGRVDFRELVKELASMLKTRIELRQVGARDESKIIGGLGPCGRPVCCANHMREFNKVGIKMAKTQGLALNPTKINGLCNRLMCCLAYEDDYYNEVSKLMPKIGKKVQTPDGEGVAIYNNLLKKLVTVRFFTEDGPATTKEYLTSDINKAVKDDEENETNNCETCPKNAEIFEENNDQE
ncbi:MAG: stage 0 sporulation family protein [Clostridia bacterium]|nr:stage 0 sporulation family protein [Clostridia bacterium]